MSEGKRRGELERNYSDETFYSDSSEDVQSKCKSATTLLQKRRLVGPTNGCSNPYRNATRMMTIASSTRNNVSSVAQKIMSAKLLRVKQLQNELIDTQFQLNELSSENRLLKTLQRRQDMALKKYEGTQAELPQLIRSHNEEVRALKAKLKQAKAQHRDLEIRLKTRESELQALREQHRRLLKLSKDKRLGEREQLHLQLEQMQGLLKEQDKKVQMLTRKVMLEGKNFKHQLATEIARHKITTKELDAALDRIAQLEALLETKEKFIAANMPRTHTHHSVSLVSLGPPARFRLYQSRGKSPNGLRPIRDPNDEKAGEEQTERVKEEEDDDDDDDDTNIVNKEDRGAPANEAVSQQQRWPISQSNEEHVRIKQFEDNSDQNDSNEDDDDEENDVDDYDRVESTRTSLSTESSIYVSKTSTNATMDNIQRENKDSCKDEVRKSQSSNKVKSHGSVSSFQSEMEQPLDMAAERKSLKRCPVGGDSTLVPEEQDASTRRGTLNGAGDNEKKEKDLGFLSSLVSEIDRDNFIRRNSLLSKRAPEKVNLRKVEKAASSEASYLVRTEFPYQEERREKSSEQILPELTVEEGRRESKVINQSWENLSTRLREEASKAKSVMEKCDQEVKDSTFKLPSTTEPYNKRNLLAALKAIDNGADPIDLNDDSIETKRNSFSSLKPTYVSTSSVALLEKTIKEHDKLQESDTAFSASLVQSKEMEVPKSKADLMQELFGGQKVDASSFCVDAITVANVRNFSDSPKTASPLRSRLPQK